MREYVACARLWRLLKQARDNARHADLEFDYFHGEVVLRERKLPARHLIAIAEYRTGGMCALEKEKAALMGQLHAETPLLDTGLQ